MTVDKVIAKNIWLTFFGPPYALNMRNSFTKLNICCIITRKNVIFKLQDKYCIHQKGRNTCRLQPLHHLAALARQVSSTCPNQSVPFFSELLPSADCAALIRPTTTCCTTHKLSSGQKVTVLHRTNC